jgi:hypothetical protein
VPTFEGQFLSIVFLGRHNPQILNHDFLVDQTVLPRDREPFQSLLAKERNKQFDQFISTPVMATIRYGPVSIIVDENRYQIKDDRLADPASSPIMGIARKYFGDLLRYTPLKVGGVNLNGVIRFTDEEDLGRFEQREGLNRQAISGLIGQPAFRASLTLGFAWHKGLVEVRLHRAKNEPETIRANFNYEFGYSDIDSFLANLDDVGLVYQRFREFLASLEVVA